MEKPTEEQINSLKRFMESGVLIATTLNGVKVTVQIMEVKTDDFYYI